MTPEELSGERGQALGKMVREYERITCRTLSTTILEDMKHYYDKGLEDELIIEAIKVTDEKGARWPYTKAILERCLEEGITTWAHWDLEVRWKKAVSALRKRFPFSFDEEEFFSLIFFEVYKEEYERIEEDLKRFCEEFEIRNA